VACDEVGMQGEGDPRLRPVPAALCEREGRLTRLVDQRYALEARLGAERGHG
jgi:hypothetical protein